MCTVHVLESSVAVLKGTASGPGSIVPPIALPSHVMITVTSCRACGVEPQSPYHVPTSGCPSWASTAVANDTTRSAAEKCHVTTEDTEDTEEKSCLPSGLNLRVLCVLCGKSPGNRVMAQSSAGSTPKRPRRPCPAASDCC